MPNHLKVRCPSCEKSLNVSQQHQGKQVKCPSCSTVFQVGTIAAAPTQPLAPQPLAPQPLEPQPLDPIISDQPVMLDQRPTESSYTPQRGTPTGTQFSSPRKRSRRELLESGEKKQKSSSGELSEADEKIQSAGFFLISLPVIATLLPLFGFQLKRLAAAGEFAPIAAGFLGMIGAGCIGYARRSKGDSLVYGGSAAAFVLLASVTGFMLLISMSPDDGLDNRQASNNKSEPFRPRTSRPAAPKKTEAQIAAGNFRREQQRTESKRLRKLAADAAEERRKTNEENVRKSLEQSRLAQKEISERIQSQRDAFVKNNRSDSSPFETDNLGVNNSASKKSDVNDPKEQAVSKNPFESDSSSPDPVFIESVPFGIVNGRKRMELHRLWGLGGITFARIRNSKKLEFGLKFAPTIGEEQRSGKLFFFKKPIVGIEVIKIGSAAVIPITEEATPSDSAIVVDTTQQLSGFNLAFDDNETIVGIQGLFVSPDSDAPDSTKLATSQWLGVQTDNIQKTVVKKGKSVHGFVCFAKGSKTTGFALVYKNSRARKSP